MPIEGVGVHVEGLDRLRKAFRQAGDKMSTAELGRAGKTAAGIVAERAQDKVPVDTGRAQESVRAVARAGGGAVAAGGAKAPYYRWLDFGGNVGRGRSVHRPVIREGRYIYPALAEERDRVVDTYERLVADVLKHAGLT